MKPSDLTPLQWIGIIILFNGTLIGGSNYLADLFMAAAIVKAIIAVASLGNMFLGGLVTMFSSQGSLVRSVAAMPGVDRIAVNAQANQTLAQIATSSDPSAAKVEPTAAAQAAVTQTARASAVLLAIVLGAQFVFPGNAQAQGAKFKPPQITGDIAADAKANLGIGQTGSNTAAAPTGSIDNAVANFNAGVQKLTKELVDTAIADVTAAQQDAQNHNDQISKPCWDANLALLKSLPTQWESPPKLPLGLALSIQIQRDLLNSITGNDVTSLKVACAALWGDQLRIVGNLGALLGVRIATGGLL